MSNLEAFGSNRKDTLADNCTKKLVDECLALPGRVIREADLLAEAMTGGVREQFCKDPARNAADSAITALSGSLLTAGAMSKVRPLSLACLATGAAAGGKWLYDEFNWQSLANEQRNAAVASAMSEVWNNTDSRTFHNSKESLQHSLGPLAYDLLTMAVTGVAVHRLSAVMSGEMNLAAGQAGNRFNCVRQDLATGLTSSGLQPRFSFATESDTRVWPYFSPGRQVETEPLVGYVNYSVYQPKGKRVRLGAGSQFSDGFRSKGQRASKATVRPLDKYDDSEPVDATKIILADSTGDKPLNTPANAHEDMHGKDETRRGQTFYFSSRTRH